MIVYRQQTGSTNHEARLLYESSRTDGLVVLTDYQTAGRGRMGRTWVAPRGAGALLSVALRADAWSSSQLALVTAVAVCDAIQEVLGIVPSIKWPNDILISGKKAGGILVESFGDVTPAYVVGVGVNCLQQDSHLPSDWKRSVTSLELESSAPIDRESLILAILSQLDKWLADRSEWSPNDLRRAWLRRSQPPGTYVHLVEGGKVYQGTVLDVDPEAALVVQLDVGGVRAFHAEHTTTHLQLPASRD